MKKEETEKIRLLFIVPYPELKEKVEFVLKNHSDRMRLKVNIQVMTVEEMPERIEEHQYEAVIARGYSAQKMRSITERIPVIGLEISGYDIVRAIMECKECLNPKRIGIFSSSGPLLEAEEVCKFLGCEARIYRSEQHETLSEMMMEVKKDGCDGVIGGYAVKMAADKEKIPSVIIRTGEETIQQAVNEAIRIVERIRKEKVVSKTYKTIIYSSKEGILYVDSEGIIQVRNRVIREMEGNFSLLHKPLREVIPFFEEPFLETISTGHESFGKIYTFPRTKVTVSAEFTPVVVGKKVSGVVINVSDITKIQDLESKIRRKLNEKGLAAKHTFQDIIYKSSIMEEAVRQAKQYANSEANVLIVGETGTGKELFAQSIHNASRRKNGPFVAINCAALPETLLESELFGYVEGAFTGTVKGGKMGLFEQAHGGTLFLDEIGEISLSIQTKLLRVLQEKEVRRIGDNKVIAVNVRIIAATNKNLRMLADRGEFRKDLMYRLDVLRLFLPPLRKRKEDLPLLFRFLLKQHGGNESIVSSLDSETFAVFQKHPFWGNIRELENVVERIMVLHSDGRITGSEMERLLTPGDVEDEYIEERMEILDEKDEKAMILWGLEQCKGNQSRTAKLLGMDRSTLWRKRQKYGI